MVWYVNTKGEVSQDPPDPGGRRAKFPDFDLNSSGVYRPWPPRLLLCTIALLALALPIGGLSRIRLDHCIWITSILGALLSIAYLRIACLGRRGYPAGKGIGLVRGFAIALLIIGTLSLPAAEFARLSRGWPLNPELNPPVVGPGDTVHLEFPESIDSVGGKWRADAGVNVLNPDEVGRDYFRATSSQETWSHKISVKSSEKSSTYGLWADLTVPNNPELAGKTVRARVVLSVTYPTWAGGMAFTNATAAFSHETSLVLAPAGAGSLYWKFWAYGTLLGGSCMVLAGVILDPER